MTRKTKPLLLGEYYILKRMTTCTNGFHEGQAVRLLGIDDSWYTKYSCTIINHAIVGYCAPNDLYPQELILRYLTMIGKVELYRT